MVFFFQAEDGIRDADVTGVQTCALPIYRSRSFTREEFTAFMFAQSKEYPQTRAILDKVASSGKYFIGAINNEPLELNQYRIEAFHLRRNFLVFFTSCYVQSRKPEETIF